MGSIYPLLHHGPWCSMQPGGQDKGTAHNASAPACQGLQHILNGTTIETCCVTTTATSTEKSHACYGGSAECSPKQKGSGFPSPYLSFTGCLQHSQKYFP